MKNDRDFRFGRWACLSVAAGGLLMVVFWLIYTTVHGPTSFDQTRAVLGRTTLFWSLLLSIPPSLLVTLGLIVLYPRLAGSATRMARIGYGLLLIGFVVPAALDFFVWGGIGPPLFVPIIGAGLILLALGCWHSQRLPRYGLFLLMFMGISQVMAFAFALIPNEITDPIGGYRIYGFVAHLLFGLGWVAFGASLWKAQPSTLVA